MKLKLTEREGVKHLAVTESLSPSDLPVLRAGVRKLLQTGGTGVILDLSQIPEGPSLIAVLREEARDFSAPFLIVASSGGDATRSEEAFARLSSAESLLLLKETRLREKIAAAETLRGDLETKLRSHADKWSQILTLRGRISRLKREIGLLENLAQSWVTENRLDTASRRPPTPRGAVIHPVLKRFLETNGLMKGAPT